MRTVGVERVLLHASDHADDGAPGRVDFDARRAGCACRSRSWPGQSCAPYTRRRSITRGLSAVSCSVEKPARGAAGSASPRSSGRRDPFVGVEEVLAGRRRAALDGDRSPREDLAQGSDVTPPDAVTPGSRRSRSHSSRYACRTAWPLRIFRAAHRELERQHAAGSKPGATSCRRAKLRTSRPAPISSTTESASSPTTSSRRKLAAPQTAPAPAAPAGFLQRPYADRCAEAERRRESEEHAGHTAHGQP